MSTLFSMAWRILLSATFIIGFLPVFGYSAAIGSDLILTRSTASQLTGSLTSKNVKFEVSVSGATNGEAHVTLALSKKIFSVDYKLSQGKQLSVIRLRVAATNQENKQKSQYDDQVLKLLQAALPRISTEEAVPLPLSVLQKTIELFVDMVPIGEKFDTIERSSLRSQSAPAPKSYTSICRFRGRMLRGMFDGDDKKRYMEQAVVGDPASLCVGRCGPGCSGTDRKPLVYTQDCFDHDLCTGHFGEWFGNCSDEWISAADDFLFGPNCPLNVVGIWDLAFSWNNGGSGIAALFVYNNNMFATNDGGEGYWYLNGKNLVLQFTVGCKPTYSGSVANTNLTASGTMACTTNSGSGSWQSTYLTVNPNSASQSSARGASTGISSSGVPK